MKKYIIYSIPILLIIFFLTGGANQLSARYGIGIAQKDLHALNSTARGATTTSQKETQSLANLKQAAGRLVTNRINSLQKLLTRIQSNSRLSQTDKTNLENDIQNAITGITNLNNKIQNQDATVQEVRSDARQIIQNYRVFRVIMPKAQLLITISKLQSLTLNLQNISAQIQNLINDLKSSGKNTASLQTLLRDINSRLSAIETTLTNDHTMVSNVTISTPNPHLIFAGVRRDLAINVRTNFAQIRHDIGRMRVDFKELLSNSAAPTSSASQSAK